MYERGRVHFPGESAEYREARGELLDAEIELRRATERLAAARRSLPPGGPIPEDYVFDEVSPDGSAREVRMSELFTVGKDTLVVYGYMYGPDADRPCPSCTSIVESLDGAAPHLAQRLNLIVVAKSSPERIRALAEERSWRNLRLLSSARSSFNRDYLAELESGSQMPMLNVFRRDGETIRHFWGSELLYAEDEPGQENRHVDFIWPLWNLLDATPGGRGADERFPRLAYGAE